MREIISSYARMQIIDISRTLANDIAPWPGDTPFQFQLKWKMAESATVNVGAIEMGVHNGTHADALYHFDSNGAAIETADLDVYFGPAIVADVGGSKTIEIAHLEKWSDALRDSPRLLLKTNAWIDSTIFPKMIPTISHEVPAWLRARGVKLLGLDVPSVDDIDSKDLPNHHALAAAGISIVESLDLRHVTEGRYRFAGLPLKIAGGDAAPIRAILWRE